MGTYEELSLDKKIEDKRPEEVSSKILKHLLAGVKDKLSLSEEPQNVIITIPASFDSDQCNATLEAAYLAGLTTKDKNGNYIKDVLLYEPKAVIYNVANMIANDEIPSTIINFNDENLFEYVYYSIAQICDYLGIRTKIIRSSQLDIDHGLRSEKKVLADPVYHDVLAQIAKLYRDAGTPLQRLEHAL